MKLFWIVCGSTFGALGGQKVAKMSSKIYAKIGIGKSGSEEARPQKISPAGARRGDGGRQTSPLGVRGSEERKGEGGGKLPPWG